MTALVYGRDADVVAWAQRETGEIFSPPYTALGLADTSGALVGALVYTDYNGHSIELSVHAPGHVIGPDALRQMFRYPFETCQVLALGARTRRANTGVRKMLGRLGFRPEGIRRRYYGPGRANDAVLYGMLREECRWLHEKLETARAA